MVKILFSPNPDLDHAFMTSNLKDYMYLFQISNVVLNFDQFLPELW